MKTLIRNSRNHGRSNLSRSDLSHIIESMKVMKEYFGVPQSAVAREMRLQPSLLQKLLMSSNHESASNAVSIFNTNQIVRDVSV